VWLLPPTFVTAPHSISWTLTSPLPTLKAGELCPDGRQLVGGFTGNSKLESVFPATLQASSRQWVARARTNDWVSGFWLWLWL
jgi:hypothetical protein